MVGRKLENIFPPRHNIPTTTEKILEARRIARKGEGNSSLRSAEKRTQS